MLRNTVAIVVGLVMLGAAQAPAQDALLAQYYGNGVHDFNAGNFQQAYTNLSAAIQAGSRDPRAYYYRALTYLRLGREAEAVADLKRGAELEAADVNQVYPVSKSIERIQGRERMALESYRTQARLAIYQKQQQDREARYQQRKTAEQAVLRESVPSRLATPASGAPEDPFGTQPKVTPSAKAGGVADPFAPQAPAGGDIFSPIPGPGPMKGGPPPAAPPGNDPGADPFGPPGPGPMIPGGVSPLPAPMNPTPTPPDSADPFGGPSAPPSGGAGASDPFGGAPTAPPVMPPPGPSAPAPATPPSDDPFGAAMPAKGAPVSAAPPAFDIFGGNTPPGIPAGAMPAAGSGTAAAKAAAPARPAGGAPTAKPADPFKDDADQTPPAGDPFK